MATRAPAPPAGSPPRRTPRASANPSTAASIFRLLLGTLAFCAIAGVMTLLFFYVKYSRMIDEKLAAGPFPTTSMLFAAPKSLMIGQETSAAEIIAYLRRAGYTESSSNKIGWYKPRPDGVEIFPGADSYLKEDPGVVKIQNKKISKIIFLADSTERTTYQIEPELVTNLFDRKREKRRVVKFADIPKVLVNAMISVEDKRFFQHSGFDPLRIVKSLYVDISQGRHDQGGSTLSMQLARGFWLTAEKTWSRKLAEALITLELEQKLSKEEIFEYYANMVPLGRRGSFSILGVGEASQAFFGKDLGQLTLPEAATIAGLIQNPSRRNPFRWPDRARARRNVVLQLMRENGYLDDRQYAEAAASDLKVQAGADSNDAPYFVDLVNDELSEGFQQYDFQNNPYRVYTTLDMNLQREAIEAVRIGLAEVDEKLKRRKETREAQVALVALDPYTGEIKALVGGRNYGLSQLNRSLAKRQPGSVFKPFVYATALATGLNDGNGKTITASTQIEDQPTVFEFGGRKYEPANHGHHYSGTVTLRQALAHSMNIPAVKIAEQVGYGNVVATARRAGMNMQVAATPSVALGAYEVTPIEVAGAYTAFANRGMYTKPSWIASIRDEKGHPIFDAKPVRRQALDPRVSYLMVNLMEEVMRSGTGAGARSRGFVLPAAGKTGTSHDGWFAGFTTKLLCVVWVGYDDNHELPLDGAWSALPVWTEFMKRAHNYREYRGARPFDMPDGITSVEVDPTTGELATPACPKQSMEFYITGSQPLEVCRVHGRGGDVTHIAGWDTSDPATQIAPSGRRRGRNSGEPRASGKKPEPEGSGPPKPGEAPDGGKKGVFGRLRDLFK